jgi:methylmalonyl-CoA/ethylmalonyl-CoA epimerase
MDSSTDTCLRSSQPPVSAGRSCKLHHIGYVVSSIAAVADGFAMSIGAIWNRETIYDPLQLVKVSFVGCIGRLCPSIELIEPAGMNSPVERFLRRGGGLHHLCYEVEHLEEQLRFSRLIGGVVVRPPISAVAFEGRRIAWVVTKDKLRLEFLESARSLQSE